MSRCCVFSIDKSSRFKVRKVVVEFFYSQAPNSLVSLILSFAALPIAFGRICVSLPRPKIHISPSKMLLFSLFLRFSLVSSLMLSFSGFILRKSLSGICSPFLYTRSLLNFPRIVLLPPNDALLNHLVKHITSLSFVATSGKI